MQSQHRVLIGSPVHQDPDILKEFLLSLQHLEKEHINIDYFFVDDNTNNDSKKLLDDFKIVNENSVIIIEQGSNETTYNCDENTHYWTEQNVWKVARYKDNIINYCNEKNYDYLFLIDSDIVLSPETLRHLISLQKDIISEIFWTSWTPNTIKMPQVWLSDEYTQYKKYRHERINDDETIKRFYDFINKLKQPGVYPVGGLGACTLISQNSIKAGVNFKEIFNLSFWGEDRHFCIRAVALGLELFADTHYPAYHIYRKSDLAGISMYKNLEVHTAMFNDFYYKT